MTTPGLLRQQRERGDSLQELARLRKQAADEIDRLIAFLDQSDSYIMTECEDDSELNEDSGEAEPSLGSFDRMVNQQKAWSQRCSFYTTAFDIDLEHDDCDREADAV